MSSSSSSSPRSPTRTGRLWQKVRQGYQLVDYHALPEYLRDNEFILRHYRADWPLKQALLSMFTIHNETLNIWTHLVGFLLFLFLTIYTAMKIPQVVDLPSMDELHQKLTSLPSYLQGWHLPEMHLPDMLASCLSTASNVTHNCLLRTVKSDVELMVMQSPITRTPFFVFLGGAMFCLFSSSICHLLMCYSERVSYFLLRLDYAGIAALIAASFYPPVYYSFMCHPMQRDIYLGTITAIGVAAVLVSLIPVFQTPGFRTFRVSIFLFMGLSGVAPICHKLLLHRDEPVALVTAGYEIAMGAFYGLGALVYATRVPERWKPGCFDIAGHSHQLFHVLVVAGAYTHYRAGLIYLEWRDLKGCNVLN